MLKPINQKLALSVAVLLMLSLFTQVLPRQAITIANAAPKTESANPANENPVNEVGLPKPEPAPTVAPDGGPSIVATLTDNVTAATKVAPGGTINYTATITNNGVVSPGDDATGVNFSDPLDANTTLVAGSVHASPIAVNDTYNWVGNTQLDTAARALPAVTANDVAVNAPAGTDTFTVTAIAGGATALGGSVTLASPSGAFTYTPPLGRPNAVDGATAQDSFNYTITNSADPTLTSTGTVKINLTGRVWYLQAGAAGDGRSNTPSGSPSAMSTAADKSTDIFYIFSNAGSLNGAFSVDAGQQLLGQGVNLVVNAITLFTAGAAPTTTDTTGNCVTLAGAPGNNTLSGFNIGNCTGGTAITGANVGTLNVSTLSINTNGGGLDLTGVSTPTVSVVLGGLTSTGGTKNVNLVGLNGTVTLASGALSGASSNAFDVSGGAATIGYSGTITNTAAARLINIASRTGGTVTFSGALSGTSSSTGINLSSNTGATITFNGGITLSTGANDAFTATGGGVVNVSGTNNITTTGGKGINWSTDTSASIVTFNNVTSTTGGAVVIASSGASNFTFNDVTATTGTTVSITTATGAFTFTKINNNGAAKAITVNSLTGAGSFTVNGTGGACDPANVLVTDCTGGTIQNNSQRGAEFITANNITLKNMYFKNANTANLVAVTPPSTCGDLASPTDDNTGCGASIHLQTVTGVTMDKLNVDGSQQIGINGKDVTNLSFTNGTVQNVGNESFESGFKLKNLLGTSTITNSTLQNDNAWPIRVQNWTGTLTSFLIDNVTMNGLGKAVVASQDGFLYGSSSGAVAATITVQNSRLYNNHAYGSQIDTTSGNITVTFNNNDFGQTNGSVISNANSNGLALTSNLSGTLDYTVTNNRFYGQDVVGIVMTESGNTLAASRNSGTISGNTIGDNAVANSGAANNGNGIEINGQGAGSMKSNILNNTISQVQNTGINIETMTNSSVGVFHIKGNTFNPAAVINNFAISVWAGNSSGDTSNVCAEIGGTTAPEKNTINGVWSSNVGIRTRQRFTTTYNVSGYTGAVDGSGLAAYLGARNNLGSQTVSASTTTAFVNSGATCAVVTPIAPPADETVNHEPAQLNDSYPLPYEAKQSDAPRMLPSVAPLQTVAAVGNVLNNSSEEIAVRDQAQISRDTFPSLPIDAASLKSASHRSREVLSNHAVRRNFNTPAQKQNAPTSGETVTLNTIATFPATKSITIKYSATVNAPPLARSVSTQGTVSGSNFASVLTDDPEPAGGPQATVTLVDTTMTWNGATSTDWNTITNWTQPAGGTQYAPGVSNPAVNDVVIPNVGAQPNISATDIGVFSLNIANGRTLTITSPRVLTIGGSPGGDLTLDGIISGGNLNLGTGTHVINNAGGTGSLSSTNVATVLSGSTVTLNNNLQAGALAVNTGGGAVMNISNRTLSLNGSGAALAIGAGATFTTTGSTVVFNGTAAQQAAGTAYNNLTINNTIGTNITGVTLTGNATVNGTLTLTSSDLDTGAFTLTQPNTTASAGVSDVVGTVTRSGGPFPLATALTFGNPNNIITFTAGTNRPTTLTAVMAKTAPATYAAAVQRNYTISQTGSNNSTATVRLHYLDTELNGNTPEANLNLRRLRTSDSHWTAPPTTTRDTANNFIETTLLAATDLPTQWTFSTFVPTAANGTISGRIADGNGNPVEGAVINLSGDQTRKTITDANGNYHFNEVGVNGFYTVTPSRVNFNFTPFNRSFNLIGNTADAAFGAISTGDNRNPLDTPEYFVRQQYVDILGREPDEGGFNYWSDQINQCLSIPPGAGSPDECIRSRRVDVAAAFFVEAEFQQTGSFIYDLYSGALGRRPVFTEYSTDRRQVLGGPNLDTEKAAFAQSFVQRPEFVAKYQSNTTAGSFVDALIQNVQQVSGVDLSSQRDALIDHYNTGADMNQSRSLVLGDVAANTAFNQAQYNPAFVLTEYFGYLQRNPDQGGYDFWLNVINDREVGNYRGMVCAFITSTEYQRRFSSVVSHGNGECGP